MSKYIIDMPDEIEWGVVTCRTEGGFFTRDFDSLEELNSDYINEHFGDLQDTAYQKGFEDGKKEAESSEAIERAKADAFNKGMLYKEEKISEAYQRGLEDGKAVHDKGCEGCMYQDNTIEHHPCGVCRNAYNNRWKAKDDKIEVGDEVTHKSDSITWTAVVTKNDDGILTLMSETGAIAEGYDEECFVKTGRHFDIASILEAMKHD